MKFLIGYSDDSSGKDALKLGIRLAELVGGSLVICHITVKGYHAATLSKVDEDYHNYLYLQTLRALDEAKEQVPAHLKADYISRSHISICDGLLETAHDLSADCIVLGAARSTHKNQYLMGSVSHQILNSSHTPIALAPKGFQNNENFGPQLKRLSCAISGSDHSCSLAEDATSWAELFNVDLRFVNFIAKNRDVSPTSAGFAAENLIVNDWKESLTQQFLEAKKNWESDVTISLEIGDGATWREVFKSIGWEESELLIIGSSSAGLLRKVFVGNNVEKIIRFAPVPRIILPRSSN